MSWVDEFVEDIVPRLHAYAAESIAEHEILLSKDAPQYALDELRTSWEAIMTELNTWAGEGGKIYADPEFSEGMHIYETPIEDYISAVMEDLSEIEHLGHSVWRRFNAQAAADYEARHADPAQEFGPPTGPPTEDDYLSI